VPRLSPRSTPPPARWRTSSCSPPAVATPRCPR
jgi:hypothetical protein